MARAVAPSLFTPSLLGPAVLDAVRKLAPAQLIRNPVMFVTAVVAALLTLFLFIHAHRDAGARSPKRARGRGRTGTRRVPLAGGSGWLAS